MTAFDHWQKWGGALDDESFANAWVALGLVAASDASIDHLHRHRGLLVDSAGLETVLPLAVVYALMPALADESPFPRLDWRFPDPGLMQFLVRLPAKRWADAWRSASEKLPRTAVLRLRVIDAPRDEPHLAWLRMLSDARPPVCPAIALEERHSQFVMRWPLRVAHLPGDEAVGALAVLHKPPFDAITRILGSMREEANSDLLVHIGSPEQLVARISAQSIKPKTNLIIVGGSMGGVTEFATHRDALLSLTRASGLVLAPSPDVPGGLLELVALLSHNLPLDVALRGDGGMRAAVSWLTDAAAEFRLEQVAHALNRRRPLERTDHVDLLTEDDMGGAGDSAPMDAGGAAGMGGDDAYRSRRTRAEPPPRIHIDKLVFDHEFEGATEVARAAEAIEADLNSALRGQRREERFLQQKSFVQRKGRFVAADAGFIRGAAAEVRVRIAPEETGWNSLDEPFNEATLPKDYDSVRLRVWLTEKDELPSGVWAPLTLRRSGPSTEAVLSFVPQRKGTFDGRLTVMHRGRVIQTAMLVARVRGARERGDTEGVPQLHRVVRVRGRLADLDARRQFDLAFVFNKGTASGPAAVALSDDRAWVTDLSTSSHIVRDINMTLSEVAHSVADYKDGLSGENGRALLVRLARAGNLLHKLLIKDQAAETSDWSADDAEYVQVVSTKPDGLVPLEFIYDNVSPLEVAKVCTEWRAAIEQARHRCTCRGDDPSQVCPFGFWGLRKIIERHAAAPRLSREGGEAYLQHEPGRVTTDLHIGGTVLVASSDHVPQSDLQPLIDELNTRLGQAPHVAGSWTEWMTLVASKKPTMLLAMPHTDGAGLDSSLEISTKTIKALDVTAGHVYDPPPDSPPLVALLGCDMAGTADDYGMHVIAFRHGGAPVIIATVATVFGGHAPRVAKLLIENLFPADGSVRQLGEALRAVKQQGLLEDLLMSLCLVAYGDADWKLTRQ